MSIDPKQFAVSVLNSLNAPVNHQNVASLVGWANAEGGANHNNPFNTTESAPGATSMNSVGVKTYVSPKQALSATIATLKNGDYGSILQALHSSNPTAFINAVGSSQWGTGGSLLNETVNSALGQNFGVKANGSAVGIAKQRAGGKAATSTTITPPKVTTSSTGGGVNWDQAITDQLLKPVAIDPSGKLPQTSGLLSRVLDAVGTGAYTTPVTNTIKSTGGSALTTIAKTRAGQQAITGKAVTDAANAGASADVQHLLKMIHNVNGAAYSTANHDDINERDVNIKASGTDCSGFVSWLMGPHGLGIWKTSLATPSIDTAPGIVAGRGKQITLWNNSNPGASGHVFIQIGTGAHAQWWASEGGGVGIHQLPLSEVQNYWQNGSDGGHYVALHPKGL